MVETSVEKTWNQQLYEWYQESGMALSQIQEQTSIPKSTFRDYIKGRTIDLSKVSPERRQALYQLTGYEFFNADESVLDKYSSIPEDKKSEFKNESQTGLLKTLSKIEKNLHGIKLSLAQKSSLYEAAQLLSIQCLPEPQDRMRIVETAIDLLVEQVDYFRSSPQNERVQLVKYLKGLGEIDRWGYVVNIIDNITKSDGIPDTFLRSMNPPKKIDNK